MIQVYKSMLTMWRHKCSPCEGIHLWTVFAAAVYYKSLLELFTSYTEWTPSIERDDWLLYILLIVTVTHLTNKQQKLLLQETNVYFIMIRIAILIVVPKVFGKDWYWLFCTIYYKRFGNHKNKILTYYLKNNLHGLNDFV